MLLLNIFSLCFLLQIINVKCDEGISLAFAIDDTLSMGDDIAQVKAGTEAIMNLVLNKTAEVKEFVLVTFNDNDDRINYEIFGDNNPAVKLRERTDLPAKFLTALSNIHPHGGGYCPELALSGLKTALINSKPKSYIYVFTDAAAKDYRKLNEIKRLCQTKQSQVVIVYSRDRHCYRTSGIDFEVYYDVVEACSGQFIVVNKDEVNKTVTTTQIFVQGKQSVMKWKMMPRSTTYQKVPFTIDDKAEYATVSVAGINVELIITSTNRIDGPTPDIEVQTSISNYKVYMLNKPKPGIYYAWVKGDSKMTVTVYGRTDFTFDYGFSTLKPKSMADTNKQPIAGAKHHLSINVTDPDRSVDIKSVQILDIKHNDQVINELLLTEVEENVYITDSFVAPNDTFRIKVIGKIKANDKPIFRYSRTNINVQHVDLTPKFFPKINIKEGSTLYVKYGSDVTLTCDVAAYPKPEIKWYTSNGVHIPTESAEIVQSEKYISYLERKNFKKSETYVCKASNTLGTGEEKQIRVNVLPVFTSKSIPQATYTAKYYEDVTIPCNIVSYLPITIKWYKADQELSPISEGYDISADGSKLTLKSLNVAMQGKYTCEATLNSEPSVKQTHNTEVTIPGLARPEIGPANRNKHVKKYERIELNCKALRGYPSPQTRWFKKSGNHYVPLSDVTSEVLTVPVGLYKHVGQYKCDVTNPIGSDSATFEVTMKSKPEMTIVETNRDFSYDSNAEFTCKVEANPPPSTIIWKNGNGDTVHKEVTKISDFEYASHLKLHNMRKSLNYVCEVSNDEGSAQETVSVRVLSPFTVNSHIEGNIGIQYRRTKTLVCDIKPASAQMLQVQWYKQANNAPTRELVRTSNKYTVSEDGTYLTINSMEIDMGGKYTCEASLLSIPSEKISYAAEVSVLGISRPEIIDARIISNEDHLKIFCRVRGVPTPVISWQFKPKSIRVSDVFRRIPGSGEELSFSEPTLKHSGVYKCIVKNDLGEIQRDFTVEVEERSIIHNSETVYYGIVGDKVMQIPCNVTGFPDPIVMWKKDGRTLNTDSKYLIKGTTLNIIKPTESDSSEDYSCEAYNKLGNATKQFSVVIQEFFEDNKNISGETRDIFADNGKPLTIKCNLPEAERGSVRWYQDGFLTTVTGKTYTIESVGDDHEGNYTCRVNTEEGSKSETYVVYVGSSPKFTAGLSSQETVKWNDDTEKLSCTANAQPPPQYEWAHNGITVNGSEVLPITHWGEYTCKVTNIHGTIQKTFKVVSSGCLITKFTSSFNQPLASDIETPTWPRSVSNSDIKMQENEEIKLSCPGDAFNNMPDKMEITAKCVTEDKFLVDEMIYKFSDLQCNSKVKPTVQHIEEQCSGSNSEIIRVGFAVNGFLDAYNVCFDKELRVPLYASTATTVTRIGTGVDKSEYELSFSPELRNRKFGESNLEKSCYAKGQLIDVNYMPFGPAQAALFNNLNEVPILDTSCDSNHKKRTSWQSFENQIRDVSNLYDASWTGASDYVWHDIGLVPRYLWKVMKSGDTLSVMVFKNEKSPTTRPCSNNCYPTVDTNDDNFLYCCPIEEFAEKFNVPMKMFTG